MARPRKGGGRRRGAFRKGDWVYRPFAIDANGVIDGLQTYDGLNTTLASGASTAAILYDSHNHKQLVLRTGAGIALPTFSSPAARAEGRKPLIMRTQGYIRIRPTSWSLGNTFFAGFRVGVFEQDPESGAILVDANYSMFADLNQTFAADWANDRNWMWERRVYHTFNSSVVAFKEVNFNIKTRRSLRPHECLAIFYESSGGSVSFDVQFWCRTFVADES